MTYYFDEITTNRANIKAWAVVRAFRRAQNALRYSL